MAARDSTDSIIFQIDPDSPIPLYHQINEHLREHIENGVLQAEDALPSEHELAARYGVNRLTVRRAISDLVAEGLLVRRHGVGTFVAKPKMTQSHAQLLSFTQRMAQLGRTAHSRVIEQVEQPASPAIARHLEVVPGTPVFRVVRLRLADGQPVMVETAYLPQSLCPDLLAADLAHSLYEILTRQFNVVFRTADQYLEPVLAADWEAELLQVEAGAPALLVETTVRGPDGRVVEYSKGILRGDLSRLYFRTNNVDLTGSSG